MDIQFVKRAKFSFIFFSKLVPYASILYDILKWVPDFFRVYVEEPKIDHAFCLVGMK